MGFVIANDHAATCLKTHLVSFLKAQGVSVIDAACENNPAQDYADAANRVCAAVHENENLYGLLLCGTGQGTAMRANRHTGIRAALVTNEYLAEMARLHNNANVLVMGARVTTPEQAERILQIFMATPFEGGRHTPRLAALDAPTQPTDNKGA